MVDTTGGEILLTWAGAAIGSGVSSDVTLTAAGNAQFPSVIDAKPPKLSGAAFWIGGVSSNLVMTVSGAANTTWVDLWAEATIGSLTRQFTTSSSGNNNTVYFLPLDGPSATPSYPAIGMTPAIN